MAERMTPKPLKDNEMSETFSDIVSRCYMQLLMTPHDLARVRGQGVLAALRDWLAEDMGESAEDIQNAWEHAASVTFLVPSPQDIEWARQAFAEDAAK